MSDREHSASIDRRTVLKSTAATAGAATFTGALVHAAAPADAAARVFRHGVASGDPRPGAVVLWTRVTPTAAATPGSGRGPRVTVTWQVARDAAFRHVVRRGSFGTGPSRDHTVKVDVTGLAPARWYYYRFLLDGVASPVGRTRTAPAADADVRGAALRRGQLREPPGRLVQRLPPPRRPRRPATPSLHLGDYLYEYGTGEYGYGSTNRDIRPHDPAHEMVALADYRRRHAQYKTDPDLQRLHARYPFIATWDDHEVANDQWRAGAENHDASRGRLRAPAGPARTGPTTSGCRCGWTARRRSATAPGCTAACGSAPRRAEHARPAVLPRPAGDRRRPVDTADPRSATRTAPSPAARSSTGSRTGCTPATRSGSWSATR